MSFRAESKRHSRIAVSLKAIPNSPASVNPGCALLYYCMAAMRSIRALVTAMRCGDAAMPSIRALYVLKSITIIILYPPGEKTRADRTRPPTAMRMRPLLQHAGHAAHWASAAAACARAISKLLGTVQPRVRMAFWQVRASRARCSPALRSRHNTCVAVRVATIRAANACTS